MIITYSTHNTADQGQRVMEFIATLTQGVENSKDKHSKQRNEERTKGCVLLN